MNQHGRTVIWNTMESEAHGIVAGQDFRMRTVTGLCVALCCVGLLVAGVPAAAQTGAGEADPVRATCARTRARHRHRARGLRLRAQTLAN